MIVKSIIAGTVLSLMAGGVVYFGTEVDAREITDKVATQVANVKDDISDKVMAGGNDHPHGSRIETSNIKTSIDTPSVKTESGKLIEAKAPIVSSPSNAEESKPQKKWLNQYLKKDASEGADVPLSENADVTALEASADDVVTKTVTPEKVVTRDIEAPEDTSSVAQDLMASMGLTTEGVSNGGSDSDTGTFIIEEELTKDDTNDKNTTRRMLRGLIKKDSNAAQAERPDGKTKTIDVKVISDEDSKSTIETETIDMGDGKIVKIIKKTVKTNGNTDNDGDRRIRVFTDKDGKSGLTADDIKAIASGNNAAIHKLLNPTKTKDISATVKIIMEQADKIKMPELRDRAYLDLVSYGLEHGDYGVASKALKKIKQVELRDTARNRIAVTYAKDGNAEEAFAILDDLEVDALRDVMRLQVIEAMIAPEGLPEAMQ